MFEASHPRPINPVLVLVPIMKDQVEVSNNHPRAGDIGVYIYQLVQKGELAIIIGRPIHRCQSPRDIGVMVGEFGCDREGRNADVCNRVGFFIPKQKDPAPGAYSRKLYVSSERLPRNVSYINISHGGEFGLLDAEDGATRTRSEVPNDETPGAVVESSNIPIQQLKL
jgi:hypothetical protein